MSIFVKHRSEEECKFLSLLLFAGGHGEFPSRDERALRGVHTLEDPLTLGDVALASSDSSSPSLPVSPPQGRQGDASESEKAFFSSSGRVREIGRLGIAWVSDMHLDPFYSATANIDTYCRGGGRRPNGKGAKEEREKEKDSTNSGEKVKTKKKDGREGIVKDEGLEQGIQTTRASEELQQGEETEGKKEAQQGTATASVPRARREGKNLNNLSLLLKKDSFSSSPSSAGVDSRTPFSSRLGEEEEDEHEDEDVLLGRGGPWMAEETSPSIGRAGCDSSPLLTELVLDHVQREVTRSRMREERGGAAGEVGEQGRREKKGESTRRNDGKKKTEEQKASGGEDREGGRNSVQAKKEKTRGRAEEAKERSASAARRGVDDFSTGAMMHARELASVGGGGEGGRTRAREEGEGKKKKGMSKATGESLLSGGRAGEEEEEEENRREGEEKKRKRKAEQEGGERKVPRLGEVGTDEEGQERREEEEKDLFTDGKSRWIGDERGEEAREREDDDVEESIAGGTRASRPRIDTLLITGDFAAHFGDFQPKKR